MLDYVSLMKEIRETLVTWGNIPPENLDYCEGAILADIQNFLSRHDVTPKKLKVI